MMKCMVQEFRSLKAEAMSWEKKWGGGHVVLGGSSNAEKRHRIRTKQKGFLVANSHGEEGNEEEEQGEEEEVDDNDLDEDEDGEEEDEENEEDEEEEEEEKEEEKEEE